jgi:hypothetical protein
MTTASTSSILSQAASGAPAGIQAWTGELFGELIACGLTQTNDTGQLTITGSGGTATTNAAQPTGTGVGNAVGYVVFTFNDSLAPGVLATTALNSGGSGYDAGGTHTYTGITATGATSGATCTCTVTVTSGVCGNMGTLGTVGNFIVGEKITIPNSSLGGSGSGASWTAATLSSGAPVIFRIDVGAGSAVTDPQAWITLGAGTNGAGVIAGSAGTTKMTQVACSQGAAPLSVITAYTSYYCYNSTLATCLAATKFGATVANCYTIGFYIHRSNNTAGAPSAASVSLYTNSTTTSGSTTNFQVGVQQTLAYASGAGSAVYPTISTVNSVQWGLVPQSASGTGPVMGLTSTLESGTIFLFNVVAFNPAFFYSAFMAFALATDVSNGVTVSTTIIGTETVTLLGLQNLFNVLDSPFQFAGVNLLVVYS